MPQSTVTIDLPDETYRCVMAFNPPSRQAFEAALVPAVISAVADAASEPDLSGIPFFPKRDLHQSSGWEAIRELPERIQDEEDAEIIAKSGITRR